jgi:hypothetical protein
MRLLQRRSEPARGELVEIKRMLLCLKSSPAQVRSAVGTGVHLANTEFIGQFGGMQGFCQIPPGERERFYARLGDLESDLRSQELGMALGVGLYRIWLADTLAGRRMAAELLGQALTELSQSASSVCPRDGEQGVG